MSHHANQLWGRYRLSHTLKFPYRGDEVAAAAANSSVRYDISWGPGPGAAGQPYRWYPRPSAQSDSVSWPITIRSMTSRCSAVSPPIASSASFQQRGHRLWLGRTLGDGTSSPQFPWSL